MHEVLAFGNSLFSKVTNVADVSFKVSERLYKFAVNVNDLTDILFA